MVKIETLGMLDVAKNEPTITSEDDVKNYSFITVDGILHLVYNTITGDDAYIDDAVIKAGEYLNCFVVADWKDKKLVVDGKHVKNGIASLTKGNVLVVDTDGSLKTGSEPASGVYFKVSDIDVTLTEAAIKVRVCVK